MDDKQLLRLPKKVQSYISSLENEINALKQSLDVYEQRKPTKLYYINTANENKKVYLPDMFLYIEIDNKDAFQINIHDHLDIYCMQHQMTVNPMASNRVIVKEID